MHRSAISLSFIVIFTLNNWVSAQTENGTVGGITAITGSVTETSTFVTSTEKANTSCEVYHNDCKACVDRSKCYYCSTTDECHLHIDKGLVDGQCKIGNAYLWTCKATFKTLLIIICVLSGIPILIILIVCCYCCCKKKGLKISKDDIKWARQREERKEIAAERRRERAERTEEIRKKYGLVKDSNPYQRFDA